MVVIRHNLEGPGCWHCGKGGIKLSIFVFKKQYVIGATIKGRIEAKCKARQDKES